MAAPFRNLVSNHRQELFFLRELQKLPRFPVNRAENRVENLDKWYKGDAAHEDAVAKHMEAVWFLMKNGPVQTVKGDSNAEDAFYPRSKTVSWSKLKSDHMRGKQQQTEAAKKAMMAMKEYFWLGCTRTVYLHNEEPPTSLVLATSKENTKKALKQTKMTQKKRKVLSSTDIVQNVKQGSGTINDLLGLDILSIMEITNLTSFLGTRVHMRMQYLRLKEGAFCHQMNFKRGRRRARGTVQYKPISVHDPRWITFEEYCETAMAPVQGRDQEIADNMFKSLRLHGYHLIAVESLVFDPYRLYVERGVAKLFQSRVDFIAQRKEPTRALVVGDYKTKWGKTTQLDFTFGDWDQVIVNAFFFQLVFKVRVTHVALVYANLNDAVFVLERPFSGKYVQDVVNKLIFHPSTVYIDERFILDQLGEVKGFGCKAAGGCLQPYADRLKTRGTDVPSDGEQAKSWRMILPDVSSTALVKSDVDKRRKAPEPIPRVGLLLRGTLGRLYLYKLNSGNNFVYTYKKVPALIGANAFVRDWISPSGSKARLLPGDYTADDVYRSKDPYDHTVHPKMAQKDVVHRTRRVTIAQNVSDECLRVATDMPVDLSAYALHAGGQTQRRHAGLILRGGLTHTAVTAINTWKGLAKEMAQLLDATAEAETMAVRLARDQLNKIEVYKCNSLITTRDAYLDTWWQQIKQSDPTKPLKTALRQPDVVKKLRLPTAFVATLRKRRSRDRSKELLMEKARQVLLQEKTMVLARLCNWFINDAQVTHHASLKNYLKKKKTVSRQQFATRPQRDFWAGFSTTAATIGPFIENAKDRVMRAMRDAVHKRVRIHEQIAEQKRL